VQRASSLMSSPLDAAFTILGPLAVAVHILQRRWSMGALLAAGVLAAGLQETQTRGAFVGAMVMVLVAVLGQRGLLSSQKVRFAAVVFGASVFLVPVVVQSSLGERLGAAISGEDEESADGHWDRVQAAWDAVVAQPLGRGIGSSGAVGERYRVVGHIFPENYFLYAALEEGVVGSLLFIGLLGSAALAIRRRPARDAVDTSAVGVIVAFGVTGLVLDSFATLSAVPVFVLIGLSLAPREANGPSPA
jgi:O-antigen ligase